MQVLSQDTLSYPISCKALIAGLHILLQCVADCGKRAFGMSAFLRPVFHYSGRALQVCKTVSGLKTSHRRNCRIGKIDR